MLKLFVGLIIAMSIIKPTFAHEWQTLCPNNQFCFDYPEGLSNSDTAVLDSTAGKLASKQFELFYDYGLYSSDFNELTDSKTKAVTIDGKAATQFITSKTFGLYFAQAKFVPEMNSYLKLSIELRFVEKPDHALVDKIFNSVRFMND